MILGHALGATNTASAYLNEQGLRQERDALRAQVEKLRKALKRCRQGWQNLDELYGVDPDSAIAEIDAALEMSGGVK